MVSTVSGVSGTAVNASYSAVGPSLQAYNGGPKGGILIDPRGSGDIYFSDYNRIYLLNATARMVSVFIGSALHGNVNGPAASATFGYIIGGITMASNGKFVSLQAT
jgi:hypothetical protein